LLKTDYKRILGKEEGEIVEVKLEDETVGYVLRSQTDIKPIFVSAGHKISQEEALRMAKKLRGEYRILEPVRRADRAARDAAKAYQGLT
jgi:deoxyribonuclease V